MTLDSNNQQTGRTRSAQCPVCGFAPLDEAPYTPDGGESYEICSCCGFQYGHTDDDRHVTFDEWRSRWVSNAMPWDTAGGTPAPAGWDPSRQLASLHPAEAPESR